VKGDGAVEPGEECAILAFKLLPQHGERLPQAVLRLLVAMPCPEHASQSVPAHAAAWSRCQHREQQTVLLAADLDRLAAGTGQRERTKQAKTKRAGSRLFRRSE